jgi:hypothetical protein
MLRAPSLRGGCPEIWAEVLQFWVVRRACTTSTLQDKLLRKPQKGVENGWRTETRYTDKSIEMLDYNRQAVFRWENLEENGNSSSEWPRNRPTALLPTAFSFLLHKYFSISFRYIIAAVDNAVLNNQQNKPCRSIHFTIEGVNTLWCASFVGWGVQGYSNLLGYYTIQIGKYRRFEPS